MVWSPPSVRVGPSICASSAERPARRAAAASNPSVVHAAAKNREKQPRERRSGPDRRSQGGLGWIRWVLGYCTATNKFPVVLTSLAFWACHFFSLLSTRVAGV